MFSVFKHLQQVSSSFIKLHKPKALVRFTSCILNP